MDFCQDKPTAVTFLCALCLGTQLSACAPSGAPAGDRGSISSTGGSYSAQGGSGGVPPFSTNSGGDAGAPAMQASYCGRDNVCVEAGRRDPQKQPFADCSPWNFPIGDEAMLEPIAPEVTYDPLWSKYGDWVRGWMTFGCLEANDNAVYASDDSGASAGTIRNTKSTSIFEAYFNPSLQIPEAPDRHVYVFDRASDKIYETFHASMIGGELVAEWLLVGSMRDSGLADPGKRRGTRAYGGSAAAGLLRDGELVSGIHHPIAIKVPVDALNLQFTDGWTWPASTAESKSTGTSGNIRMGTLLALPPDADLSQVTSPELKTLAQGLIGFGAYVVDAGSKTGSTPGSFPGCISYLAENGAADALRVNKKYSELGAITSQLRVVANNSPSSIGGGGTPRACFPSPI